MHVYLVCGYHIWCADMRRMITNDTEQLFPLPHKRRNISENRSIKLLINIRNSRIDNLQLCIKNILVTVMERRPLRFLLHHIIKIKLKTNFWSQSSTYYIEIKAITFYSRISIDQGYQKSWNNQRTYHFTRKSKVPS